MGIPEAIRLTANALIVMCMLFAAYRFYRVRDGKARVAIIAMFCSMAVQHAVSFGLLITDWIARPDIREFMRDVNTVFLVVTAGFLVWLAYALWIGR